MTTSASPRQSGRRVAKDPRKSTRTGSSVVREAVVGVQSESTPGVYYTVRIVGTAAQSCTCPSHAKGHRHCKHMKSVEAEYRGRQDVVRQPEPFVRQSDRDELARRRAERDAKVGRDVATRGTDAHPWPAVRNPARAR